MKYTRVRIEFKGYEDRLNRTFLVKGNPDLFKFATFLAFVINSKLYHCYEIITSDTEYVMASFMEHPLDKYLKHMMRYRFSDLPSSFEFLYDTGENYLFRCYKIEELDLKSNQNFFVEKATGQGIWEDNSYSLRAYLEGKIDPTSSGDYTNGYSLPWNFTNECFKDFDNEVDIERLRVDYSKRFSNILSKIRKDDKKYIAYYHLSMNDIKPDYKFKVKMKKLREMEALRNKS